jgi:hypothetical protein
LEGLEKLQKLEECRIGKEKNEKQRKTVVLNICETAARSRYRTAAPRLRNTGLQSDKVRKNIQVCRRD